MTQQPRTQSEIDRLRETVLALEQQVAQVIVGQHEVVRGVTIALLAGGHVLLEGLPGLGKTMLVRSFAQALRLRDSRIQFTPDLMPADVTGTNVLVEREDGRRTFEFQPGPIFANLVLADEINRATPKTQAALLEAMQEGRVTVGTSSHELPRPFFVLATQNPIELEGTYPLPEAELDRFFFKLQVGFPSRQELVEIVQRTTGPDGHRPYAIADAQTILALQELVREVPAASHVVDYAARIVLATHPDLPAALEVTRRFIRLGASPRAAQALILAGKIHAVLAGRLNASYEDVRRVAVPALRHRLILNYDAQVNGVTADAVIRQILARVPEEA
ncbi:MoxR family ATPase [Thermomicrobiaceae bacterium CFH 74404]|uniref:MoxR family ATPase n=1 Tax=Thermalbibacter longus TaxID=2951981 RepID=A0AA41WCR1_9BACT|nr:MoxR family ATPase [Thermalbibacter longus]MCM8747590.1 MoxR family ATPase [Thermalbibacter longus]